MKLRKRSLPKKTEDLTIWYRPQTCKNCGHVDTGKYCSNCGQSFKEINRPVKEVIWDFFSVFSLDSSIFNTLGPFLFKPGFITSEYLAGKRKKYMSPIRLYLFLSIIFFFLARVGGDRTVNTSITINEAPASDSISKILENNVPLEEDSPADVWIPSEDIDLDSLISAEAEDSGDLGKSIQKVIENKSLYYNNLLKNISYALFILMPIFALILQLLYIRRKRFYMEHLIFSLNMHSFALFVLSLVFILKLLFKGDDNYLYYLLCIIPVYFTIGMLRFYTQKFLKTLLKEIILFFAYGILLTASLIAMAAFTLYRM